MKKIIATGMIVVLCIITAIFGTSCKGKGKEIAFITNMGPAMDGSNNQAIWDGVKQYAKKNKKKCEAYEPSSPTPKAYETSMELAIENGAKVVISSDYLFEQPVYHLQSKYPKVKFILFNAQPRDEKGNISIKPNTLSISFKEEQIGFLAGYMAVKDGYRKLGFMGGMKIPTVIRYGYGFTQGAEYAVKELNLKKGEVSVHYTHFDNFDDTEDKTKMAREWYNKENIEIVYACCGNAVQSIIKASEESEQGKIIGCDIDQSDLSKSVVTSVVKKYSETVSDAIESCYSNTFLGGKNKLIGAKEDGIGITFNNTLFKNSTKEDYNAIYEKLKSNQIKLYQEQDKKDVTNIQFESINIIPIK